MGPRLGEAEGTQGFRLVRQGLPGPCFQREPLGKGFDLRLLCEGFRFLGSAVGDHGDLLGFFYVRRIAGGEEKAWDIGGLGNGRYFTYVAAFGAFTDVSYETPQQNKQALGHLAYILEGMNRITRLPHAKCRIELSGGEVEEGDFIFGGVTNSLSVAGLVKLDPELVGLDDGRFEISLVRYPETLAELNTLMGQAVSKNLNGPALKILHAESVKFSFERPVSFTRDGEPGGSYTELTIKNHRRAVRIIC